jgi:hypothetical protein
MGKSGQNKSEKARLSKYKSKKYTYIYAFNNIDLLSLKSTN